MMGARQALAWRRAARSSPRARTRTRTRTRRRTRTRARAQRATEEEGARFSPSLPPHAGVGVGRQAAHRGARAPRPRRALAGGGGGDAGVRGGAVRVLLLRDELRVPAPLLQAAEALPSRRDRPVHQ